MQPNRDAPAPASSEERVIAWILPDGSPLRSEPFVGSIREAGAQASFRSLYVSTEKSLKPAGLEELLASIRGSAAVLFEVPSGDAVDPLLFLLLGTVRGAHANVILYQAPGSKPLSPRVRDLLHSPIREFASPGAVAGELAKILPEAELPRAAAVTDPLQGPLPNRGQPAHQGAPEWSDWRTAQALLARGTLMGQMNQVQEEVATYEEIVSRFGKSHDRRMREVVIRARVNEGTALRILGRNEEALRAFEQASEMASTQEGSFGLEARIRTLVLWGEFLGEQGRYMEAISKYEEAKRASIPGATSPGPVPGGATPGPSGGDASLHEVKGWIGRATLDMGNTLNALGRQPEALATYGELASQSDVTDTMGTLTGLAAEAMMNQAITLTDMGRKPEAMELYASIVQRFGAAREPVLVEQVVKARINRGMIFGESEAFPLEFAEYADVAQRLAGTTEVRLMVWQARAILNAGAALGQMYRYREALARYDEVVRLFESLDEPALAESVARAMLSEAETLVRLGQDDESSFVVHDLLERFEVSQDPAIVAVVAEAEDLKARLPPPAL